MNSMLVAYGFLAQNFSCVDVTVFSSQYFIPDVTHSHYQRSISKQTWLPVQKIYGLFMLAHVSNFTFVCAILRRPNLP